MRRIPRFIRLPRAKPRIRADIDEEIRFDIEMRTDDLVKQGLALNEARDRAAREFGDLEDTRRYCEEIDVQLEADARRRRMFEDLRADLAIALRGIRRTPLFATVVMITLALGIGANTAVFSVVRRVLVAPLPFRDPGQLYRLYTSPSSTGDHDKLSAVELIDLAAQSRSLDGLTCYGNYAGTTYSDDRIAEPWQTVSVIPNFFSVFGIQPTIGRVFTADDFQPGAPAAVMITYQLWSRVFGADRAIAGRVVRLSGKPATIVGVLPERFVGPTFSADVLRPLDTAAVMRAPQYARSRVWRSVARLKPGVSLAQWEAELGVLRARIQGAYPDIKKAGVFIPMPLHEAITGEAGPVLRFVMGGALVVLLAACVNIAGLFLSRAVARQRELGVRTALGASRGRLIRQAITETMLYGLLGGAIGLLLAVMIKKALLYQIGPLLPQVGEVRIDLAVLAFAFAASVVSGVAFALFPAVAATRVDVRDALGDGGMRAASRGTSSSRASRMLVSAQVACAVVLVVGAGLLIRSVRSLVSADVGYETSAHQASFFLSTGARTGSGSVSAFVDEFVARVHAIPGVTAVGYSITPPWYGIWRSVRVRPAGMTASDGDVLPTVALATASAEFFPAVGIPVRAGRGFSAADRAGAPVVVINESMARRFWPNTSPIGARIYVELSSGTDADPSHMHEIIGVVNDVRSDAMSEPTPTLYVSAEQTNFYGGSYVVRTTGDAETLLGTIKGAVHDLDTHVPMLLPKVLTEVRTDMLRRQQVAMTLIAMFAALAVLLAGLGIYGIMAYSVASRTKEFGIRTALGASPQAILRLVLRDGFATSVAGVVAGGLIAAAASRAMTALLFGVTATDPVSYVAAIALLLATAVAACVMPARLATRVEPVDALRAE
jgi:predicted permease